MVRRSIFRRLSMNKQWLIVGASVGLLSGACMAACGGGGGSGTAGSTTATHSAASSGTMMASSSTGGSTTTMASSSSTGGAAASSSSGGTGGAMMCQGKLQSQLMLHPPNLDAGPGTIYCPFSGVDGGKNEYCVPGTQ